VFRELLASELSPYATLTSLQLSQLEEHFNLLLKWNQKLNLTRITSLEEAVRFHYAESLFLATKLPMASLRIADVGSGAGFPGIPIAIFNPAHRVTLIESDRRKAVFLREATRGLGNVEVLSERAEHVESGFDWLVSRAVSVAEVLRLRLSRSVALLVGREDAQVLAPFAELTLIPWGNHRTLALFLAEACPLR
jgi:16S rRNA (guanine(527)-N(7))-methyltransferase RsmG